jgi:peptidoglycan/xylan/chitin deacetylase (PgdA/CDA1 family)
MSLHHRLLARTYRIRKAANSLGRALGVIPGIALRVLTYHDVSLAYQARFAAQLRWVAQSWRFVAPAEFAALITGEEPIRGRNVLLTFDDGFASQRRVAEQVLNPMGIRALFFVVSDFVSLVDREAAQRFIAAKMHPLSRADQIPIGDYNMGWSDLAALLEQGHSVGGHTRTHARLAQIEAVLDLEREIIGSSDALEHRLGVRVEHFAYTFGDLDSFSPVALAVARRRFRFIYSGLRGDNAVSRSPLAVRRESVVPGDPVELIGAYLEGAADFRYARARARLARWCRQECEYS